MTKLDKIKETALMVSDNKLDQLRIEEELLVMLLKNSKEKNLSVKSKACERLSHINNAQLEILGAKVSGHRLPKQKV